MTEMPPAREWKTEEDQWLADNYTALGGAECARRLGRTKKAVYSRAEALGLMSGARSPAQTKRTPEIEQELRQAYRVNANGATKRMARRWNVTHDTIRRWARDLGLTNPKGQGNHAGAWAADEEKVLEATPHLSAAAVRARLARRGYHRSEAAIVRRRQQKLLMPEEAGYLTASQVAKALGVHYDTVRNAIERGDLKAFAERDQSRNGWVYVHQKAVKRWIQFDPSRINRYEVNLEWLVLLLTEGEAA